VVLDIGELVGQRVRLVIVNKGQDADRLTRPRRPFLFHELASEQVTHELAPVAVAPPGAQPVQCPH